MSFVLWTILGVIVILLSSWGFKWVIDTDNDILAMPAIILFSVAMVVGFVLPFTPLIQSDIKDGERYAESCEDIGGSYQVIGEEWAGEYYVDIYGCVKK